MSVAEADPVVWHAPGRFDPATGERIHTPHAHDRYQDVFGEVLCELAEADRRVVGAAGRLQKTVGGKIETVYLGHGLILIVNEEGKRMNLEPNFRTGRGFFADTIVGTAILVGQNGEDFGDVPITFQTWKSLLKGWGN